MIIYRIIQRRAENEVKDRAGIEIQRTFIIRYQHIFSNLFLKKTNNGEWKEARKCVEEDENLNEKQREILKKILSKAEESPSAEGQQATRNDFQTFVDCAGKTAEKIVKAFSKIKSVAEYFGISQ